MIKRRLILLCASDIAVHYRVAPGTIRRWACQDQWHPYGTRRFRTWSLWDAQESYERRHTDTAACA